MSDGPKLFFRINGFGADIFRVDAENRQRRLNLHWIGRVFVESGKTELDQAAVLTPDETAEVDRWLVARREALAKRHHSKLRDTIEDMNKTAGWLVFEAGDDDIDAIGDDLLLAIHDLRNAFVWRKSKQKTRLTE